MENHQFLVKEKLEFFGILKESLNIPYKNPKFIIFTFLASLPLFSSLLINQIIFQQAVVEMINFVVEFPPTCHFNFCIEQTVFHKIQKMIKVFWKRYLILGLSYVGMVHVLELVATIMILNCALIIYTEDTKSMTLKEMLHLHRLNFEGPLVTSIYVLYLSFLILLGYLNLAIQLYAFLQNLLSAAFFGLLFIGLLIKHVEWSAIWNMGMVISVLEEKHGIIALGVSGYFSRGSRRKGQLLMLIFFVWRIGLWWLCVYVGWDKGGSGVVVTAVHVGLVCLGNAMKWLVFLVYFYDCKKRCLEKKVDTEMGKEVEDVK